VQDIVVSSSGGDASGVTLSGGTTQSVSVTADVRVSAADAAVGVQQSGASDAVTTTVTGALSVTGGAAGATGIAVSDGTSQSVQVDGAFTVSASDGAVVGVQQANATGAASLAFTNGVSVTGGMAGATGIAVSDGTSQSVQVDGAFTVSASDGAVVGVRQANGTGAASLAFTSGVSVTGGASGATGLDIAGGTSQSVQIGNSFAVSATGGDATGVTLEGGQIADLNAKADFSVSNSGGSATGVEISGSSTNLQLARGLTVSANGGAAIGVVAGGSTNALSIDGAIAVTATGANADAVGIELAANAGATAIHLPTNLSVQSSAGAAQGIIGDGGAGLTLDGAGSIDASAAGSAYGIYLEDQSGAIDVNLASVTAVSTGGLAAAVVLDGSAGIQLKGGTFSSAGAQGGVGVALVGSGATGDIQASLDSVSFSGTNGYGLALIQEGGANVIATVNSVAVTGDGTTGVLATSVGSGTVSLTIGGAARANVASVQAVANAAANGVGVTSSGADGTAVRFSVVDGAGSVVNKGVVATTGSNAIGIAGASTGTGALAVTNETVTTTGSGSHGIALTSGAGAQTVVTQTVAVSGADAQAINAASGSGSINVTAVNTSAVDADAIHLVSTSGAIAVTLSDGGATRSGAGAGLSVDTGGSATINLGTSATSATLHGATAGLSSYAAGGQTVTLSGVVGADSNLAVSLAGGAATLLNRGVINGAVSTTTSSLAFTNAGTWNASGTSSFAGSAVLTNTGTININAGATTATTMTLAGLSSVRNSGTISLANGQVGDVLDLDGASFVGSGTSRVVLDANLGASAVGSAAAQSSDVLRVGAASGVTTLVIRDVSGVEAAQFNFTGIRVVDASSATAGAFVLDGGSISKGFAQYQLVADSEGNLNLVGLPTDQAFTLVRTGAEARRYWRRSADAWAEQMRAAAPHAGLAVWGQLHGGEETNRSRPVYTETVLGTATRFTPKLDVRDSWAGGQLGLDWGQGDWSVGVTGGYLSQQGRLTASSDEIKLSGGNLGVYLRYQAPQGFFVHALGKVDRYTVKYALTGGASASQADGTSYGFQIEAGYHLRAGALFFEPAASIAVSHADIDDVNDTAGGLSATFANSDGAYGRAGLRAGIETASGGWRLKPYLGAAWEGELSGQPSATLDSGGTSLRFADTSEGGRARIEAGVEGTSSSGLAVFAKAEAVTGANASGFGGRAGVALRW
jgi:Autotransporter beta-domain